MSLSSFISKQFIDVVEWPNVPPDMLCWKFPMQDNEIQNGGKLVVRETQAALFVNEGQMADLFSPGTYTLSTQTLPVLTYLKNWDKLFQSPFKSDVYYFNLRAILGRKWGTPQPITVRDTDFGMVRMRAFGQYAYTLADPKAFFTKVAGTRDATTVDDVEEQLRALIASSIATTLGQSKVPFLDMAANQTGFADAVRTTLAPNFSEYGLHLDTFLIESVSLPESLQAALDRRSAMGMAGDLGKFTQYQAATAIPIAAANEGGLAGIGAGLGAGVSLGGAITQAIQQATQPAAAEQHAAGEDVAEALRKLHGLFKDGILTEEEFNKKKAELLAKL